jgi:hypothetical protein
MSRVSRFGKASAAPKKRTLIDRSAIPRFAVHESVLVGISKACFAELAAKLFDKGVSAR